MDWALADPLPFKNLRSCPPGVRRKVAYSILSLYRDDLWNGLLHTATSRALRSFWPTLQIQLLRGNASEVSTCRAKCIVDLGSWDCVSVVVEVFAHRFTTYCCAKSAPLSLPVRSVALCKDYLRAASENSSSWPFKHLWTPSLSASGRKDNGARSSTVSVTMWHWSKCSIGGLGFLVMRSVYVVSSGSCSM